MTPEEMADELLNLGWGVMAPITQKTCRHPTHSVIGFGCMDANGGAYIRWRCQQCGKHKSVDYARGLEFDFGAIN